VKATSRRLTAACLMYSSAMQTVTAAAPSFVWRVDPPIKWCSRETEQRGISQRGVKRSKSHLVIRFSSTIGCLNSTMPQPASDGRLETHFQSLAKVPTVDDASP